MKLDKQIQGLVDAQSRLMVQIDCIRVDLSTRSISKITFDIRHSHLIYISTQITDTLNFLRNFHEKAGNINSELCTKN